MAKKTLLVAMTTERVIDGEKKRVRFEAGSVVDLTEDEETDLTKLQDATGKLHFRDPKNEGGKAVESDPEIVEVDDFAGQKVAIADKSVDQLKAYLTFNDVAFKGNASKADLVTLVTDHEKAATVDPDAGL